MVPEPCAASSVPLFWPAGPPSSPASSGVSLDKATGNQTNKDGGFFEMTHGGGGEETRSTLQPAAEDLDEPPDRTARCRVRPRSTTTRRDSADRKLRRKTQMMMICYSDGASNFFHPYETQNFHSDLLLLSIHFLPLNGIF